MQFRHFNVANWTVEPLLDSLRREEIVVTLEPRVMEVLVYLAHKSGDVVSIDELVAEVWCGTIVGDRPVYQSIARLRRALGDDAKRPRYIATIPKRGYRLIAPVVFEHRPAQASDCTSTGTRSIAVLSFVDMSDDHSLECFGDGIAEELIHKLSSASMFRVAARSSSFAYKGQQVDVATIGGQLNVDSVLEGSVRKYGARLRITAQLIDSSDGFHIWSRSFERGVDDMFAIQDEIAGNVLQALAHCDRHRDTAQTDEDSAYSGPGRPLRSLMAVKS